MYYPAGKIKYAMPDPAKMCGDGHTEELERAPQSPYLRAVHVKFVDGARTKWHYHSRAQILMATQGQGFVELRGLPVVSIYENDRVIIPAGVWHRHGAVEGESLGPHGNNNRQDHMGLGRFVPVKSNSYGSVSLVLRRSGVANKNLDSTLIAPCQN